MPDTYLSERGKQIAYRIPALNLFLPFTQCIPSVIHDFLESQVIEIDLESNVCILRSLWPLGLDFWHLR